MILTKFFREILSLRVILLLYWAGLSVNSAHTQFYSHQYAVVVGIDKYTNANWPTLSYARKDAEAVTALLTQLGYKVYALYDDQATRLNITSVLEDQLAPVLQKNDAMFFFFAGHGTTRKLGEEDWGYIIPCDGTDKSATYISMEDLQTLSRKMRNAKHQAFIMDCCYGGLLGRKRSGIVPTNSPNYLTEISNRIARQVLTAGGQNQQVVDGGPYGHSLFTGYFLKAIQERQADFNHDEWVSFNELVTYILPAATRSNQTPAYATLDDHAQGEFLFNVAGFVRSLPKPRELTPAERNHNKEITEIDTVPPAVPTSLSVSQRLYALRSTPINALSENIVKSMLVTKKLYDRDWNSASRGLANNFAFLNHDNDEIVQDYATNLKWQKSGSQNVMTFEQAQAYILKLNIERFANISNWRLPTLEEAMSLLKPVKENGNFYADTVFDSTQQWIWTADKVNDLQAWGVFFNYGYCHYDSLNYGYYVRAVCRE